MVVITKFAFVGIVLLFLSFVWSWWEIKKLDIE